jgi:hypothetical protein
MIFSKTFIAILIVAALLGISIATVTLLILLVKDIKSKQVW